MMCDEPVTSGGAAGSPPTLRGMPVQRALLSPALRSRLREEADWALTALRAAGIAIFARIPGDVLAPLESRGILHPEHAQALAQQYRGSPLERALGGTCSRVTLPASPNGTDPPALAVLRSVGVRTVLAVPLGDHADDETVGVLVAAWHGPRPRVDRTLVTRIAAHVALALAYARQQKQLESERWCGDLMQQAIDAIMQQVHDCTEDMDMAGHMDTIIANAVALLDARAGAVALTQDDGATVCYAAVHNLPKDLLGTCVPAGAGLIGRVLATGQPVLLDTEYPPDGADTLWAPCDTPIWIAVPITVQGVVRGVLSLAADPPRRCSARDTALLLLFARFSAASLRMQRLLERARQAAAMEQRQALARDLHDSVTQTVFSLQLAAQVALDTWQAQPVQARTALEMVLHLAQGAGAEMRALLFELRENALESEGLARALERYVGMVRHRSGLPVDLQVEWICRLPVRYEEVLYRVAQEALTNVVKHACAAHVSVALAANATSANLYVEDDGTGFVMAELEVDSYGLVAMRERVSALGGTLRLGNRPAGGAYVHVELPLPEEAV